jgi:protein involved in polysaccharide export with SLBB domain
VIQAGIGRRSLSPLAALALAAGVVAADPVRPGDVLEISVEARPDLGRLRTVQTTGVIWMPRLAEVPVAGLTPDEIGKRLTELMARHEPTRPRVTVRLAPDENPFVSVMGAVHRPGRHKLEGRRRLVDVLLAAGGFTAQASGDVQVLRRQGTFADGSSQRRFHLPPGSPTPDALRELETSLHPGDVVTAALALEQGREQDVSLRPEDPVEVEPKGLL